MKGFRSCLVVAMIAVIALTCDLQVVAGPDYKQLYEDAMATAIEWQDKCFTLSAEIGRQKSLVVEALALHAEAEADVTRLAAEVDRLVAAIAERDAVIEAQAAQLRKLLGTERYTWLLAGLLAGAVGGYVVGSPGK